MHAMLRRLPDWRLLYCTAAVSLLAANAIAMKFTSEVNWGAEDFLLMGLLLGLVGLAAEGVVRMARSRLGRMAGMAGVALAFLLIWAQLAVGIV